MHVPFPTSLLRWEEETAARKVVEPRLDTLHPLDHLERLHLNQVSTNHAKTCVASAELPYADVANVAGAGSLQTCDKETIRFLQQQAQSRVQFEQAETRTEALREKVISLERRQQEHLKEQQQQQLACARMHRELQETKGDYEELVACLRQENEALLQQQQQQAQLERQRLLELQKNYSLAFSPPSQDDPAGHARIQELEIENDRLQKENERLKVLVYGRSVKGSSKAIKGASKGSARPKTVKTRRRPASARASRPKSNQTH